MKKLEITPAERELLSEDTDLLSRVATFQYQEPLGTLMERDLFTCGPECTIRMVAAEMGQRSVSSVVVTTDRQAPVGIVTERDMVKKVVALPPDAIPPDTIGEIMSRELVTCSPDDTLFDALSLLARHEIKHLPIVDGGRLVGIVTMRQLLKLRHFEPVLIIGELDKADSVQAFREVREKMPRMAEEKLALGVNPLDIVTMLSLVNADVHRRLLARAIQAAGPPPVEFCVLLTGSHGRRENLLFPDQDFGLILEDYDDRRHEEVENYFIPLTLHYSQLLDDVGFPYCTGYVMGQNPTWRKRLHEWYDHLNYLFAVQGRHTVRYMTLVFDAAFLYGRRDLFASFRDRAFLHISQHHEVLRQLHEEEDSHAVPLGVFGSFVTERRGGHRGAIDMKRSALIFLIEAARVLALKHGIRETSTIERLRALVVNKVIHGDDAEYFENAYRIILGHTLKAQIDTFLKTGESGYYLNPGDLSERNREILKRALRAVSRLQELVGTEFGEPIL